MQRAKHSLQRQLLLWLLIPQLVFWLVGGTLAYSVAAHYADDQIDQNLLQTARALNALVQPLGGHAHPDADKHARALLEKDSGDIYYYSVRQIPGGLIFGNQELSVLQYGAGPQTISYSESLDGHSLRAVALVLPFETDTGHHWISIQIAKGHESRQQLLKRIFLTLVIPLLILALITSWLVWWGIGHGLKPFKHLQTMLEKRRPQDLSPFDAGEVPKELDALIGALNHLLIGADENIGRQRRFIGDAAHQLRTPLAGLKSQTELAMRESTSEPQRNRLAMVHTSATRSIHLVNQLLTLARSEPSNQDSIMRVHMDLAKLVRELTAEAVPRAIAAGIDLGCDSHVGEAWIEGNSALLRELFVNLVENAIKYIPRGGCVTVRLTDQNKHYIVEVEDDGAGIPDEDKPRVFERFYRRQQDGTGCGLGMAIVKEIAERHGGTVELLDAQPHGLIVRVELPH